MAGGAALGLAGSLFKKKPKIPKFQKVDQAKAQQEGIAANLASFDQAKQLADQTAAADQDRLDSILTRTMPDYRKNLAAASASIGDMLSGKLGIGDQAYSMRQSAERGGALGLSGSGAGRNLTARDLGMTSFQMQQYGLGAFNQLSSNVRQNYTVNPMSTAFSYASTPQYLQNEVNQNQYAHQAAVGRAQSNAANSWQSRLGGFAQSIGGMAVGAGLQGMLAGPQGPPTPNMPQNNTPTFGNTGVAQSKFEFKPFSYGSGS